MNGGPSQVDTWDYKPELEKRDGQELEGLRQEHRLLHRPGRAADEVAVQVRPARAERERGSPRSSRTWPSTSTRWRSSTRCWTESNNHSPALFQINTGMSRMGFPCVGSWVTYGLGTESQNLPGVRRDVRHARPRLPKGHAQNWGAGFLPSVYQGTALKPQGDPIDNLDAAGRHDRRPAAGAARPARQAEPAGSWSSTPARPSWPPAIESFELAYRMQMAAPEALDVDAETEGDADALRPRQPEVRRTSPSSA